MTNSKNLSRSEVTTVNRLTFVQLGGGGFILKLFWGGVYRSGNGWLNVTMGLLEQRWFLLSPKWLALALWKFGEAQHNRLLEGGYAFCRNDRITARRHLLLSALRNPLVLRDQQVVNILVKTTISQRKISQMRRLRKRA